MFDVLNKNLVSTVCGNLWHQNLAWLGIIWVCCPCSVFRNKWRFQWESTESCDVNLRAAEKPQSGVDSGFKNQREETNPLISLIWKKPDCCCTKNAAVNWIFIRVIWFKIHWQIRRHCFLVPCVLWRSDEIVTTLFTGMSQIWSNYSQIFSPNMWSQLLWILWKLECFVALCRALLHPQLIEEKNWVKKFLSKDGKKHLEMHKNVKVGQCFSR